ncbi:uncharacterized protein [Centruroides vittatus]|uniref:uncharacterized protein n=1 Tax=Centruroides vittatus TaxID=120091 RepID=UPI00350F3F8D
MSCYPLDSCHGSDRSGRNRNCKCDTYCSQYGDCCLDAKFKYYAGNISQPKMECHKTGISKGYYVVASCDRYWKDGYILRKCQESADITDPLSKIPVTSGVTSATYRNYYCAICNYDSHDLDFWLVSLRFSTLEANEKETLVNNYIKTHLTYNPYCREWGVWLYGTFHIGKMNIYPPGDYEEDVFRTCFPDVTSHCAPNWRIEAIERQCQSYTAVVFRTGSENGYKNVHCALCNYVSTHLLKCSPRKSDPSVYRRVVSLASLLEIKTSDCDTGEYYDPFFKKCRNVVCGFSNRILVGGKCVRIGRKGK